MSIVIFLEDNSEGEPGLKSIYLTAGPNRVSIHDYAKKFEHNREFYKPEWIQKWAQRKTQGKNNIKDLLIWRGQSLWPLFEYVLYADLAHVPFDPTSRLLYYIDVIHEIFNQETPKTVIVPHLSHTFFKLVVKVAKQRNIPVEVRVNKSEQKRVSMPILRFAARCRIRLRQIVGWFAKKRTRSEVLLLSNERFCHGSIDMNTFWGSIIKEISGRRIDAKIVEFDVLWNMQGLRKMISRHVFRNYSGTQYIGTYYDSQVFSDINEISMISRNAWRQVRESRISQEFLKYRGISLFQFLKGRFELGLTVFSYFVADVVALGRSIIRNEKPKAVMIDHEMNFFGIGVLVQSRWTDFVSIALQYESVNTRTSTLRHIPSKTALDKKSPYWRPLADVKCASGNYAKKLLITHCNFREDSIVVTGQPRYDALISTKPSESRFWDLELDKNKKTIVYATKFRIEEKPIWLKLKAIARDKGYQLVFKVAPSLDENRIKKLIGEERNIWVRKDINLIKLLSVADVLITIRSTVAMEAMVSNKPVVLVDFYHTCQFPYRELGAVLSVEKLSELENALDRGLYEKKTRAMLQKGADAFLEQYLFKQDGKATERVVDVLEKQIKRIKKSEFK